MSGDGKGLFPVGRRVALEVTADLVGAASTLASVCDWTGRVRSDRLFENVLLPELVDVSQ